MVKDNFNDISFFKKISHYGHYNSFDPQPLHCHSTATWHLYKAHDIIKQKPAIAAATLQVQIQQFIP